MAKKHQQASWEHNHYQGEKNGQEYRKNSGFASHRSKEILYFKSRQKYNRNKDKGWI